MFGPHVNRVHAKGKRPSIVQHIAEVRRDAKEHGFKAEAFQIFVAGPRSLEITLSEKESEQLAAYIKKENIRVVAHGTYMDSPWGGNAYLAKFIRTELALCSKSNISGLVVHLTTAPVDAVMEYLPRLVTLINNVVLYLEVSHVKPYHSHYETPKKLAVLFAAIRKQLDKNLNTFGLCVDTAHLWSSGVDIRSYKAAAAWIAQLDSVSGIIPPKAIMIHLNDSFDSMGSGLDHHAGLGKGSIWSEYKHNMKQSGLAAFVEYAVKNNITTILERKPAGALLDDYAEIYKLTPTVRVAK